MTGAKNHPDTHLARKRRVPSMWGRLPTCAAVGYRRRSAAKAAVGRLTIGRSLPSCPTRFHLPVRAPAQFFMKFRGPAAHPNRPRFAMACPTVHGWVSLVPQGGDGVEAGRLQRRPEAEEQTDAGGDAEPGDYAPQWYGGRQVGDERADGHAEQPANQDADHAAGCGKVHGFHQELPHDIATP